MNKRNWKREKYLCALFSFFLKAKKKEIFLYTKWYPMWRKGIHLLSRLHTHANTHPKTGNNNIIEKKNLESIDHNRRKRKTKKETVKQFTFGKKKYNASSRLLNTLSRRWWNQTTKHTKKRKHWHLQLSEMMQFFGINLEVAFIVLLLNSILKVFNLKH